ncbi:MAG: type II toxin-antitoxin system VapC family toxin [SAR324 cluster bacterium]|nr:type II toxin-antitoxin system VapC family toxin [SAR324 cluster bacterium]
MLAPQLLYYEVIATAQYYKLPIDSVSQLLNQQIKYNLPLIETTEKHRSKAIEIVQMGHPPSGYPSIYDAIFHAIAVIENGIFVTADRKHFVKANTIGHITMLETWEKQLFS